MRGSLGFVSLLLVADINARSPVDNGKRPNIVLILTDDQDLELGSMNFMPNTLRRIRDEGVEMRRAYSTTPMCCPSRSSLFTGRYAHNHEVYTNGDSCSSRRWQQDHEPHSFGAYLSNAGYRTGYFGKYLNQYDGSYVPPGWREWNGLVRNSVFYNYSLNTNGRTIEHGFDYSNDYISDLIANESVAFLRRSKNNFAREPVMLFLSFTAPHGPQDAAPQFSHLFLNVTTHHTPAYDHSPNLDKQWILRETPRMKPIQKRFTNLLMAKRLQTLQSVDAAVDRIYRVLEELGELENTYIVYTSDHGYHSGQFGLVVGKGFPFEFDVRVPFYVRGPDIKHGSVVDDIILNIDLGPTFLDMAGLDIPARMDGSSFKTLLPTEENDERMNLEWRDTFLIESPRFDEHKPSTTTPVQEDGEKPKKTKLEKECEKPKMICFVQDNDHWRTAPFWTEGPFCSCTGAMNNTYTCVRTINATHNYLYCHYDTGFRDFYDLTVDPFQLTNRISSLTSTDVSYLNNQLADLRSCKGTRECAFGKGGKSVDEVRPKFAKDPRDPMSNGNKKSL